MAVYEIPTIPAAQTFLIGLAGQSYRLTLAYREADDLGGWILDIADNEGAPLLSGIPLVTGSDLLAPYAYLGFGGSLLVFTEGDADAVPTYTGLGSESRLYFVTED